MSTWTTDGKTTPAGDHFGDHQVGVSEALLYTAPDRPGERVVVTFGTVLNQAGRYSGEITTEHQTRRDGTWDSTPGALEVTVTEGFLQDHDTLAPARQDCTEAIHNWARQAFQDAELHIN